MGLAAEECRAPAAPAETLPTLSTVPHANIRVALCLAQLHSPSLKEAWELEALCSSQ